MARTPDIILGQRSFTLPGGRTLVGDEIDKLLMFSFYVNGTDRYSSFRLPFTNSDYQVPALKKLIMWSAVVQDTNGASAAVANFGYDDVGGGFDQGSVPGTFEAVAPTSPQGEIGLQHFGLTQGIQENRGVVTLHAPVPATKFPGVAQRVSNGNLIGQVFCTLEDE